ncbi:MAG: hypothetical protein ACTSWX_02995 [Promethearchaeota archaeon]
MTTLIFLVLVSSGSLSILTIGFSNASGNVTNNAELEYKRGVCENSSIFESDAYESSDIIQSNLKSKPFLSERFEMEGYYYINEVDLEAETFNKIEDEYNAVINLIINEYDVMLLEISSKYIEGEYELINQGSHEIIGKNAEIYFFYDYVLTDPIRNLIYANARYVIYGDNSQFSIGGINTDDINFDFQGVINKGHVHGNPYLTTYYESLESKENVIPQSSSECKVEYRKHYENPRDIYSIMDFEMMFNKMNLTSEDRELADNRLEEMRSDLDVLSRSSSDGRYSRLKDQNVYSNSPKSAGILGDRYAIMASELDLLPISIVTKIYVFAIIALYDAVDLANMDFLLSPTKTELTTLIWETTDQSAWIWTSDHFLMFLLVSCHSRASDSRWDFGGSSTYYIYSADIRNIWDNNHSPKWTNVVTFSCYSASYPIMRYAWLNADWYGAKYNAELYSGSKVPMWNTGVIVVTDFDIITGLLMIVTPDTTVDLWFLSIFWQYGLVAGLYLVTPIYFACFVYDIHMDLEGMYGADTLYGTGNYIVDVD